MRKSKQSEKVKTLEVTVLYQALGLTLNLAADKAKYYTFNIYTELTRTSSMKIALFVCASHV